MTGEYFNGIRDGPISCQKGLDIYDGWFKGDVELMETTARLYTALEDAGLHPWVSVRSRKLGTEVDAEMVLSSSLWADEKDPELVYRIAQFNYELDEALKGDNDLVVEAKDNSLLYHSYLLIGSSGKIAQINVRKNDGKKQPENRVLDQILASF